MEFNELNKLRRRKLNKCINTISELDLEKNLNFINNYFSKTKFEINNLNNETLKKKIEEFNEFSYSDNYEIKEIYLDNIVGTFNDKYQNLTWHQALPFLVRFQNVFPLATSNIDLFFEKMKCNDFDEKLKLIEHPKGSHKYFIKDGNNRIITAKNLGLCCIKANVYYLDDE